MSNHDHKCPDCNIIWSHLLNECLVEYGKYPCVKCFFIPENNHVLFLGSTPEAAKEAAEIHEHIIRKSTKP